MEFIDENGVAHPVEDLEKWEGQLMEGKGTVRFAREERAENREIWKKAVAQVKKKNGRS